MKKTSNTLHIKDCGYVICPEYAGNICHTLKKKETELNNVKQELEVYKKALDLACVALEERTLPTAYFHRNNFLKKARKEE